MRFRAEQRLRRQSDFRAARERGRRIDCGGFTFWYLSRSEALTGDAAADACAPMRPRVGVVASRAAVGNAVCRNRAKRLLRDVFRRSQEHVPPRTDLLLVAKRSLLKQPLLQIEQRFLDACRRAFGGTTRA